MALNKKLPMSDRINTNSIAKDIDIITGLNFSPNIKNDEIDTNEYNENDKSNVSNESNVIDITTTSSNNKTTNKTKQNNSNEFQPFLNKIVKLLKKQDLKKLIIVIFNVRCWI